MQVEEMFQQLREMDEGNAKRMDAERQRNAELAAENARLRIVSRFLVERIADTGSDRNFPVSYHGAVKELTDLGVLHGEA